MEAPRSRAARAALVMHFDSPSELEESRTGPSFQGLPLHPGGEDRLIIRLTFIRCRQRSPKCSNYNGKGYAMSRQTLQGKVALVTGAGRRVGRAIAIALAEEGVNIVIHYRYSAEEASKLGRELHDRGMKSWLVKADFEDAAEYETLIARSLEMAGSLDILINNASIFPANTLQDVDVTALMKNMEVNAWAPFVLSRDFARLAGRGQIVNLLDSRINGYDWRHVAYILSKHVLSVLTKMTALEFAPNIAVNGVAPGLILPPPGKDHSFLDRMADTVPLERHGDPSYIADAVIYLLKSDFLTGEVIRVDGGRHLMEHRDGSHID